MKRRNILVIGSASVLLLLSILFGAFFAGPLLALANGSSTAASTPTTTNAYCQQYVQDLAQRLNVPVSTLQQDQVAAREDVLNQMVKDGKLTQAQADMIKQRLASHQACSGKGSWGQHFVAGQFLKKYRPDIASEIAKNLNLSVNQLQTQLKSGQSLSAIATAQHVSSAQLHTIVTNAIQDALKKAVSAGDLTQAQSTAFTQSLQAHPQFLDRLLNGHVGKK